jgi:hypothetical protein
VHAARENKHQDIILSIIRNMEKSDFLNLMKFPEEWYFMYPDELYNIQLEHYSPGDEQAPEHYRFGAFIWWLRKNPNSDDLAKIKALAEREEDQGVRDHVLSIITNITNEKK